MKNKQTKYLSKAEGLVKLQKYCAYQERCHQEVRTKLISLGIYGNDLEEIIAELIAGKFLNEERFARSFARGKFRMRHWGRIRIISELKFRKITDYCIRKAMSEIDEKEYHQTLREIIQKKRKNIKGKNIYETNNQIAKYVAGKGFESELIWMILNE